jgi:hypothetical protein
MIKEYLIAIILGSVLGLGITNTYHSLKQNQNPSPVTSQNNTITPPPSNENQNQSEPPADQNETPSLSLSSPQNYDIVDNSKIEISGSATPQSTIVINTPVNSYVGQADNGGQFNLKVDLETGFNIIQISSIDPDQNQSDLEITITYSTVKI